MIPPHPSPPPFPTPSPSRSSSIKPPPATPAAVTAPPEDPSLSRQAAYTAEFAQGRTVAARIGDMPIRYQAAKAGLGAAYLPCWLGDSDPDLVPVVKPEGDLIEDVYLVMHRDRKSVV